MRGVNQKRTRKRTWGKLVQFLYEFFMRFKLKCLDVFFTTTFNIFLSTTFIFHHKPDLVVIENISRRITLGVHVSIYREKVKVTL